MTNTRTNRHAHGSTRRVRNASRKRTPAASSAHGAGDMFAEYLPDAEQAYVKALRVAKSVHGRTNPHGGRQVCKSLHELLAVRSREQDLARHQRMH